MLLTFYCLKFRLENWISFFLRFKETFQKVKNTEYSSFEVYFKRSFDTSKGKQFTSIYNRDFIECNCYKLTKSLRSFISRQIPVSCDYDSGTTEEEKLFWRIRMFYLTHGIKEEHFLFIAAPI